MKAKTILLGIMLLSLFCAIAVPARAQTAKPATPARPQASATTLSPQARLKQYVASLQKTPGNQALREKIIKLALTMKPAPALPQEAQDELAKGNELAKQATGQQALIDALAHFERAALLAPWWPDAYSSLGSMQEKLERIDDARTSLTLYLLAAPNASDADAVRAKIASFNPEERLRQAVAAVRSSPNDIAARQRVIRIAQAMKTPPTIPEEAREHYVMAQTFVEKATVNTGFASAIQEYKAALLAAPWWAEAYKKLALAQKAANQYDDAIASLNLYLLTQPTDARDAQDEIYKLKADKQAAADQEKKRREDEVRRQQEEQERARRAYESSPEGRLETLLRKINGRRYARIYSQHNSYGDSWRGKDVYEIRGRTFHFTRFYNVDNWNDHLNAPTSSDFPIKGFVTRSRMWDWVEIVISDDGEEITLRSTRGNNDDVIMGVYLPEQ
jgi:tetratricopeptide (TPR) repeat protein